MSDAIQERILATLRAEGYVPQNPRQLARTLDLIEKRDQGGFRDALRALMDDGRIVVGSSGNLVLPSAHRRDDKGRDEILGSYRHNRRGFGFVVPTDPTAKEDLFIPPGHHADAITGDIVRARITRRGMKEGKSVAEGKVVEVVERKHTRFAGTLGKVEGKWLVQPDGNTFTEPILTPDAAGRHVKPGTKVVVEVTQFPDDDHTAASGVIVRVLGEPGEKDVDLHSVIVQHGLPGDFPDAVLDAASDASRTFDPAAERSSRLDLTNETVLTIDPVDAKDFDDAISLRRTADGLLELGVHIADVSHFVERGSPLDEEAVERGNSAYFPGHVIPMLPEVLSNGVCSLQDGVERFVKTAFITLDEHAKPVRTRFANSIIHSDIRLRYEEAQAIIDDAAEVPHPDGSRKVSDYPSHIVTLLRDLDALARRIQKRRLASGQLVLNLPEVDLVLNEEGQVVGTKEEDPSFTHTLIEMFMVEANEAVARLLDRVGFPFLRRIHPDPDTEDGERLGRFIKVAGHSVPDVLDRHAIQALLTQVKGRPEAFAINLAILKSLTRAEYSPQKVGHFALASENYAHFTSPIRRYADLTIHRLLDAYFAAVGADFARGPVRPPKKGEKVRLEGVPTHDELVELARRLSFTERRAEDAERELRQVKILTLMEQHVGEEFRGVVTGITNFGLFIQLETYLVDGLVRYQDLLDDWWDVDARGGTVRGERTGQLIQIGDVCRVRIARVDLPRRELDLTVLQVLSRGSGTKGKAADASPDASPDAEPTAGPRPGPKPARTGDKKPPTARGDKPAGKPRVTTGATKRSQRSKQRDRRKDPPRRPTKK